MTDEQALIRAICVNPWDQLPRLVYADWLEENGQESRATLVREGDFPETWSGVLRAFLVDTSVVFSGWPIAKVALIDRLPRFEPFDEDGWIFERVDNWAGRYPEVSPYVLPREIFQHLDAWRGDRQYAATKYYRTEADALDELSKACVRYGRKAAGLPPLVWPSQQLENAR